MAARKKTPAKKKSAAKKQPATQALGNDPFARGAAARELKTAPPPSGPRERVPTPELQEKRAPSGAAVVAAAIAKARTGDLPSGQRVAANPRATAPRGSRAVVEPSAHHSSPTLVVDPAAHPASPDFAVDPAAHHSSPTLVVDPTAHHASPDFTVDPAAHHSSPTLVVDPAAHHASPDFAVDPAAHHSSPTLVVDPAAHAASPDVAVDPAAHHDSPTLVVDPAPHRGSPEIAVDPIAHHEAPSVEAPFTSSPTLMGAAPTPPPPPFESSPTLVSDASLAPASPVLPTSSDRGLWSALLDAVRAGVGLASRATQLDHWGKDASLAASLRPLGELLYERYFRVQVEGAQHLPTGPCVIVANHAGALPLDGPMLHLALRRERPDLLESRWLLEDQVFHAPFAGVLANRLGAVRANPENAHRLLDEGRPIIVFPEGFHGLSKPFSERYQLRRFGRGGYVKIAVRRGVPIVPAAIVGGEESMPLLAKVPARFLGVEHLPITPPPLPTRWFIRFAPAFDLSDAPPQAETNLAWVERTNLSVRDQIEAMITDLLRQRPSVF